MMRNHDKDKQFQTDHQYTMPDALKQKRDYHYRVGYEASTNNNTDPSHTEKGKRT